MSKQSKPEVPSNSFTRSELHNYFNGTYSPEQVDRALVILAQNGADIDPNGDQFSLDITEELEEIFKAVGVALDNQKKLGGNQDQTLTVIEATQIAAQRSPHANPELIAAMIRIVTEEAIALGTGLTQIRSQVLEKVLQQGDHLIAKSILNRGQQSTHYIQNLAGDSDRLNSIMSGYGVNPTIDIDAFLLESRQQTEEVKTAVSAIAPAPKSDFDIDQFLLETKQ